ncbi:hypothetical protein QR680_002769 [Steinernema hermaphroditum]|uniref:Sodium leak channel NALCN n=1 Tax=Steinernema hermaphroditum TaxID=289476 RepID=A0AA39LIR8_9BILA|nr:hypothetical protein QR680_002769 [Steinernema hermaphroditum]
MPKEARPGIVQDVIAQASDIAGKVDVISKGIQTFISRAMRGQYPGHGGYVVTDEANELPKRSHVPQQVEETAAPFIKESSAITRKEHEFLLKVAAEVVAAARNIPAANARAGKSCIHVRPPKVCTRLRVSFAQLSLGLEAGAAAEITRRSFRFGKDDSGSSTVEQVLGPSNPFLTPANARRIVQTLCQLRPASGGRENVASLIGADPPEIVFTSSPTESNNLARGFPSEFIATTLLQAFRFFFFVFPAALASSLLFVWSVAFADALKMNTEMSAPTRLLVAKAAVISSAMLARKNSTMQRSGVSTLSPGIVGAARRESITAIADLIALGSSGKASSSSDFLELPLFDKILQIACVLSLFTVCLHTPMTIEIWPPLSHIIFVVDFLATGFFCFECIAKMKFYGISRQKRDSYVQSRWSLFELFLLLLHIASLLLHANQIAAHYFPQFELPHLHKISSTVRCMRPVVVIRIIKVQIKFKLPKNRIQQLLKRSREQVQNVCLFMTFFMMLYAIMGIQLFGRMDYHCVLPGTDPKNVSIADLAIPDTMCSKPGGGGYQCPDNMVCMKLDMTAKSEGYYGMFNNFVASLFTVYLAASEEGWVYVLYDCMDSLPSYLAFIYFATLIFFLAWLVKNVFIAVITETFAEIRVQFSEMWTKKEVAFDDDFRQKLEKRPDGWRLIRLDADAKVVDGKIKKMQAILRSMGFQCFIIVFVLLNSFINASFVYYHDPSDQERKKIYYYIECGFTILFNIECLVKIACYGFRQFIKRNIFKFELLLCIGSTLNIIKFFYDLNIFTYFQVFRLLRLIKASPMLEDFVFKIFSPGKKLGGLVIFTVTFVIIASAVSLQLFCNVPNLPYFQTFPVAFMSMFQIITQEGWTDFVIEVLRTIDNPFFVIFTATYFVGYHFFVTLIVLSLFVAVILDNLEMEEDLKRVKQLKAREATTCMRTTLPLRLQVFEKFPTRPQMVELKKVDAEFPVPKVRDSFTHLFVGESETYDFDDSNDSGSHKLLFRNIAHLRHRQHAPLVRHVGPLSMKHSISSLLLSSNRNRHILTDSFPLIPSFGRSSIRYGNRKETLYKSRNQSSNAMTPAIRAKQIMYEQMTENGDLRSPTNAGMKKDHKQGEIDIRALQQKRQMAEMTRNRIEEDMRENHPYFDRPLFFIGRDSKLRRFCHKIVYAKYEHNSDGINGGTSKIKRRYKELYALVGLMPYLDWTMVIVTALSCASMLFESPWPTTGENLVMNNFYLQIMDYLFVLCMTFELAVKIIANGLFFTPQAAVRDVGGMMTVFIYITSLIFLLTMPKHVEINSPSQLLMICRALRPLRIYTLVPHIRRVVVELFRGFKEIVLVTILMIVVMFIFASFGVQTVGGKLAACNDPEISTRENCTGVFWQKIFVTRLEVYGKNDDEIHPKILVPRVWTNPRNFNFDHVGNAMLALFETLSYKGWNVIRDILWARQGPWAVVFIHIYVFIGCMIGLTLFVGVVIANYTQNRGTALLTVDQRRWHDLKARLKMAQPLHVPPKPAESAKLRRVLYDITMTSWFNNFFAGLVLLNSFTLFVPWNVEEEDQMHVTLNALTAFSGIVNVLFMGEILLKIVAFTVPGFWQSRRNRIDLLITMLGIFWVITHFFVALPASVVGGETRLKKFTYTFGYIVVIMRFFTITGRNTTLKMLMLTVVMSMFRSFFIITAMFLLVLFYAYTGVILFGMVKYGQAVSKHVNFRSGSEALVVLFRSVTGEDWNDIMHDCMRSAPFCYWRDGINYWETDCGNYYGAIIYFCSFYLIITYIVRNLLVAIIMENFSLFYSSEEDALLSYADIRNFQNVWNMVDIEQKSVIPVCRVKFLLRLLKGRLEVDPNKDRLLFKHMCYEMERLHNGDDVSFHDVLYMLSYRSVDIRKSLQLEELLQREEMEYIIEEEVAKQTIRTWLECCLRKIRNPSAKDSIARYEAGEVHPQIGSSDTVRRPVLEPDADAIKVDDDQPDQRKRKKAIRSRRKSIDIDHIVETSTMIQEAARKFLLGTSKKSWSTHGGRGANINHESEFSPIPSKFRTESKSIPKGLQIVPHELADVEEWSEETTNLTSPQNPEELKGAGTSPNHQNLNIEHTTLRKLSSSASPAPSAMTEQSFFGPTETAIGSCNDIKNWWEELAA